ncbi:protein of unknown function [Flavobacterium resistens]|uniref:DUF4957 domain-containing protein n=1 Tax=Flavobacterium resistens TaxID=443612 RepID=A0A521EP08_9FLAO|nr:DUF5123 domain-containing protein [Flavobacterium resistens]MRX67774.1 DUF4957 domain-containing protein [Flavobacterium resistens]SMO85622.1 protein of unknown function [Flavobacterium resistens]
MKTIYILKGVFTALVLMLTFSSCDTFQEEVIDSLDVNRAFSPIELKATVRNETSVELNWTVKPDADHYVVQFSADDTEFKTIYKTVNVAPDELPVKVQLEGETVYSIRVKAVSSTGLEDSKWSVTTATTLSEQLFYAVQDADVEATQVTLRWPANTNATQITVQPGNITHTITAAEKTAGVALVTGLTGETAYTATLLNGTKKRGTATFKTGIDIGTGILVKETDDLNAKITAAPAGSVLVLMPGDYKVFTGEIILTKSVTIRGLRSGDRPKLHVRFTLNAGVTNLSLIDLDVEGTTVGDSNFITINGASTSYGDILISGSYVHDYLRALVYGNASAAKVTSFTVDNSIVKSVNTNAQADFIDFRNTYVANITVKNSTFDSCSVGRDFVRADAVAPANGFSGTGLTTNVLIDSCTLYKTSDTAAPKRILYVRFGSNSSTVKNTLITSTSAIYTNQALTILPTFSKNYYNLAPSFIDATIANNKIDSSATTADPQFVSAATGNFKVQNQTLIDNKIGDPRWLK